VASEVESSSTSGTTGRRFVGVVGRLTTINALVRGLGLITGPLIARALGPDGRGELAAILVPLGIVPVIAMLGLLPYSTRQVARGVPPGVILGSVGSILILTSVLGMLVAVPIADYLADGRETVRTFLIVGLLTLPISVIGQLLISVANGLELWRTVMTARLIPPLVGLVGIVGLYVAGELTVASAAIVTIVSSIAQVIPGTTALLKRRVRPRLQRSVIREGTGFGLKAWVNQLTANANARLDQLLMIRMVSSSELGLYAVGSNAASVAPLFTTALVVPLSVRVARGESKLVARAVRTTIAFSAAIAIGLAVVIPFALPLLFGDDFSDATLMCQILLLGTVPAAGRGVLAAALTAGGRPGAGAIAQTVGLIVTVPSLIVLVPELGGEGAALVSSVVALVIFLTLIPVGKRHFGLGLKELLVLHRRDLRWARDQVRAARRARSAPVDPEEA
jgi:O-antigen/teichoic acid export membrane protein